MCRINQTGLGADDVVQLREEELATVTVLPIVTEFKDQITTAIRSHLKPCDGLEVTIEIDAAKDIPYKAFWARVDPKEVIPQDTDEWDVAQRRMGSPIMWVYFMKLSLFAEVPKAERLRSVREAIQQVIDKYSKIYDEGTEFYPPRLGLDPKLYIIYLWQFNLVIGPRRVRAVVPPPCIARYNSELPPEDQRDIFFTTLHLDDENDPNRKEWEEDWNDWTRRDYSEHSCRHPLLLQKVRDIIWRVYGESMGRAIS